MESGNRSAHTLILVGIVLAFGCGSPQKNGGNEESAVAIDNQLDQENDSIANDVKSPLPQDPIVSDVQQDFQSRIARITDTLASWGFQEVQKIDYSSKEELSRHWWFRPAIRAYESGNTHFFKRRPDSQFGSNLPEVELYQFKRNWKFTIEMWRLQEDTDLADWFDMLKSSEPIRNQKPPHVLWKEDGKIYFIAATAAADWFEYGDRLVQAFTGRPAQSFR